MNPYTGNSPRCFRLDSKQSAINFQKRRFDVRLRMTHLPNLAVQDRGRVGHRLCMATHTVAYLLPAPVDERVGSRVKLFWPGEERWYHGKIDGVRGVYMARTRQSLIRYWR